MGCSQVSVHHQHAWPSHVLHEEPRDFEPTVQRAITATHAWSPHNLFGTRLRHSDCRSASDGDKGVLRIKHLADLHHSHGGEVGQNATVPARSELVGCGRLERMNAVDCSATSASAHLLRLYRFSASEQSLAIALAFRWTVYPSCVVMNRVGLERLFMLRTWILFSGLSRWEGEALTGLMG